MTSSDQLSEETDQTCPVCGQDYDHKREDRTHGSRPKLRTDATACRTAAIGDRQVVYVHIRGDS